MFAWYQRCLVQRPMLTQSLTTATLFAVGDGLAQQAVEKKGLSNHDVVRSGRMALYGGAIFGPVATKWFQFMQNRIQLSTPGRTLAARVSADQLLCAPTMIGVFLTSMSVMEGIKPQEKLQRTYWDALKANWTLWPMVQAGNLWLVPLQYRVLVVNVVNIGWNCFLSLVNSDHVPEGEEHAPGV
ncbi:integral membrane protein, Mpv17/PMP22 family [Aspergillus sclerotiicarbonarius CBS 121057]|uniref:Integral membrane protein, Mpv17/PMP22 family n=1 Tax=Aspergillus sclerotiicarbonarius (strain CBS 121057 / IBT 28362) TaxID=1448318 RepID=A0A319ETN3_ASPSB|nr:integral membrane protein, Mpv17/PMP22 family [Aspergillus sclerotiicarbonarius CBS 121057]